MVLVAPRSAKLVEAHGARFTLLLGYVFVPARLRHDARCCGTRAARTWSSRSATRSSGVGVGFAGTPASHSLTGSVPVTRAGMASGTADLQRDLGGAIMQSIFGALLTAGYAAAVAGGDRRVARRRGHHDQRPEPADEVVRERGRHRRAVPAVRDPDHGRPPRQSFLDGDRLGVPRRHHRRAARRGARVLPLPAARRGAALLESYHEEDSKAAAEPARARRIRPPRRARPERDPSRRHLTDAYHRGVTGRSGPGHREVMGCNW